MWSSDLFIHNCVWLKKTVHFPSPIHFPARVNLPDSFPVRLPSPALATDAPPAPAPTTVGLRLDSLLRFGELLQGFGRALSSTIIFSSVPMARLSPFTQPDPEAPSTTVARDGKHGRWLHARQLAVATESCRLSERRARLLAPRTGAGQLSPAQVARQLSLSSCLLVSLQVLIASSLHQF
jgi:hypothetical protein